MLEPATLRQRLAQETRAFDSISGAIFTTFNFSPDFFEQNILPTLFGIEGKGRNRRRVQVNAQLASTPVAVFYDGSAQTQGGGEYRYQPVSVWLKGGVFHPKLILVAGMRNGESACLVLVSSANLSLGGWGRNEEVVGSFWLATHSQKEELLVLLDYLDTVAARATVFATEVPERPSRITALPVVRAAVESISTRKRVAEDARFRMFGLSAFRENEEETAATRFINPHRSRWDRLTIFSPYWSNQESTVKLAKQMRADSVRLVIAPQANGQVQTLGVEASAESGEYQVEDPSGRFRHAKLYVAERSEGRSRSGRVILGSANMTTAALGQPGGKMGAMGPTTNVEALVAFPVTGHAVTKLLPTLLDANNSGTAPADDPSDTDERPPLEIFVCYDWVRREYRINSEVHVFQKTGEPKAVDLRLELPGLATLALDSPEMVHSTRQGPGANRAYRLAACVFKAPGESEERHFSGLITEVGLEESEHRYTPALALEDFFSSWASGREELIYSRLTEDVPDDEEAEEGIPLTIDGVEVARTDQLDATNLFEIYRALYVLEQEQLQPALENGELGRVRDFLYARPDSIDALVRIFEKQETQRAVRFALLLECQRLLETYDSDPDAVRIPLRDRLVQLIQTERSALADEMGAEGSHGQGGEVLSWFEDHLQRAWS